jgi:hypothetical protein
MEVRMPFETYYSGEAKPHEVVDPGGGALASGWMTHQAGLGDNQVAVPCPGCTNNSLAVAGVCEGGGGNPGLGSAVLAVYNVVPGLPRNGFCTVIFNSGWNGVIGTRISVVYTIQG